MQAKRFLRAAARAEFQAEELYSAIAEAFFHAPGFRETFQRLASEERQHAMRLRLLERHGVALPWTSAETERRMAELEEMSKAVALLRRQLHVPSSSRDPGLLLGRLAEVEERFSDVHAEHVAGDADPAVARLFASMARQDAEHGRLIRRLAAPAAAA
jgi:rubrerythrin